MAVLRRISRARNRARWRSCRAADPLPSGARQHGNARDAGKAGQRRRRGQRRDLKIVIVDDATRPAQATNALRKLAGDDKVLAIAGPLTSSAAEVTFPVANEMKVVATSQASSKRALPSSIAPGRSATRSMRACSATPTVPYFKKTFDIKSVTVIYDAKDATAATVGTKIMPALMKENEITVANEGDLMSFNTGDLDVSAQVTKMKALNPDALSSAQTIARPSPSS